MEWEKRFNAPRLVRPAGAVLVKLEAMSKNRRVLDGNSCAGERCLKRSLIKLRVKRACT